MPLHQVAEHLRDLGVISVGSGVGLAVIPPKVVRVGIYAAELWLECQTNMHV